MHGKIRSLFLCLSLATACMAQDAPVRQTHSDTSFEEEDFEALFSELDALLDSLTAPRSFVFINLGIGSNYFNYTSKSSYFLEATRKTTYTPTLAYYSKTGLGLSTSVVIINDGVNLNPYQFYLTGSYDYIDHPHFITGAAYTKFFTKDSVPFYTSPLKNELYAYFTYKKTWLKPSLALSYGWGSRTDYEEREEYISTLRLARNGYTRINTRESINDFNLITSVRHDFYWMDILGKQDYIRFTPQLVFASGTQKFGFNQTSSTYATMPRTGLNYLYSSNEMYLDDELQFQPLSMSAYLKAEYSRGRVFIQPQLVFDYYFPATHNNLTCFFVFNAGVIF
ncbi:MAG: hypothetical protein ACXWV0_04120 [Flavisolibacter sp.]